MAERVVGTIKTLESEQKCSNFCKRSSGNNSSGSPADRVLQLQRTAGNQAVQRLMKSRALQAKLRIGQPNDIYEQEADRVAEQVMRMPDPILQRKCPKCNKDEKKILQAKESAGQVLIKERQGVPPIVQQVMHTSGQQMDVRTQEFMEHRLGHDFSKVRIHTDARAMESARAVNALAYTVGNDVIFGEGQYRPNSKMGRKLLAHELSHVVQQKGDSNLSRASVYVSPSEVAHEAEANGITNAVQSTLIIPDLSFTRICDVKTVLQRNEDGKEKSRQSKPRNAPPGTRPIDQSGLDREDIHKIKDGIGAGPRDWVGVTPDGDVITTDKDGNAENHGPVSDYLRESHSEIPDWVWPLVAIVGIFVVIAIVACFATGVCEFGAVVAGVSYATAIISLLKNAGIKNSESETTSISEEQTEASEGIG
jgi:hypothetical protein